MTNAQREWIRNKAQDFIDELGEESIEEGIEEADYYSEGLEIVQRILDAEKETARQ